MEKFLRIINKKRIVDWILNNLLDNYTIVFEYSDDFFEKLMENNATEIEIPKGARHNYNSNFKLKSYKNITINTNHERNLMMQYSNVLSLYRNGKLELLIADDYHKHCFSCSKEFYNEKYTQLLELNLIK